MGAVEFSFTFKYLKYSFISSTLLGILWYLKHEIWYGYYGMLSNFHFKAVICPFLSKLTFDMLGFTPN
jgi:hypothetical protein